MEIKGDRRGLRLIAKHFSSNDNLVGELRKTLKEKEEFLRGASLLIEVPGLWRLPPGVERFCVESAGIPMTSREFLYKLAAFRTVDIDGN